MFGHIDIQVSNKMRHPYPHKVATVSLGMLWGADIVRVEIKPTDDAHTLERKAYRAMRELLHDPKARKAYRGQRDMDTARIKCSLVSAHFQW